MSLPLPDTDQPVRFEPTRAAALDRLLRFAPKAGSAYAQGRNADLPGHPHVSVLSPYIRHRALTEAEVAQAVLAKFAPSTAEKFLQEVVWRTYFKGWLERRPSVWTGYRDGLAVARNRVATEAGLRAEWEAACNGQTGIAPFDHWARDLVETGYLHNHARMWFASIWMHTLRLPWELGADFFLRHLLDGDPASNTLSWRWVGGLHTRGKVYRARASNIAKFTDDRWDARTLGHQLAREDQVAPLDGADHPAPRPVPEDADWDANARTALILTEDELHPDFVFARGLKPDSAAILLSVEGRSPWQVSANVHNFTTALAQDANARLQAKGIHCAEMCHDPQTLADWINREGFEQVVAPYAPVGPGQDALDRLEKLIDIPMVRPIRAWDQAAWPYATAGFFKVKSRIPDILETILEDTVPQDMAP